jgi:hypothetical protein
MSDIKCEKPMNFALSMPSAELPLSLRFGATRLTYPADRAGMLARAIIDALEASGVNLKALKPGVKVDLTEEAGGRLALTMMACDPDVDFHTVQDMIDEIHEMEQRHARGWLNACTGPLGVEKVWDFRGYLFKRMNEWG